MQPRSDESSQTDTGRWPASSPGSPTPQPVAIVSRARPWLVGLVSFLVLLVIIAAASNQWVTDAVARHTRDAVTFGNNLAHGVDVFQWRFTPQGGSDIGRFWVGNLAAVGVVLLLTLLLVPIVVRGYGRFWQSLFGIWFTVLAATVVSGYARSAIVDTDKLTNTDATKLNGIFYGPLSPNSQSILAGVIVGLVVAIIGAIVTVGTRRDQEIPAELPSSDSYAGPLTGPWQQQDADEGSWQAAPAAPGPVGSPSPWSSSASPPPPGTPPPGTPPPGTAPTAPQQAGPAPAGPTGQPTGADDDAPHHTAVLPTVDPGRRGDAPTTDDRSATGSDDESASGTADGSTTNEDSTTRDAAPAHEDSTTEFPRHSTAPPPPDEPRRTE